MRHWLWVLAITRHWLWVIAIMRHWAVGANYNEACTTAGHSKRKGMCENELCARFPQRPIVFPEMVLSIRALPVSASMYSSTHCRREEEEREGEEEGEEKVEKEEEKGKLKGEEEGEEEEQQHSLQ